MSTAKILELMRPYWGDRSVIASYVGGQFIEGHSAPVEVRNAHDDSLLLSFPDADESLVDIADKAAKAASSLWPLRGDLLAQWVFSVQQPWRLAEAHTVEG
ncbi:aldehyde dehydrogenase family protein, partial [Pseudomonas amygdali pv. mori str. 301020]